MNSELVYLEPPLHDIIVRSPSPLVLISISCASHPALGSGMRPLNSTLQADEHTEWVREATHEHGNPQTHLLHAAPHLHTNPGCDGRAELGGSEDYHPR